MRKLQKELASKIDEMQGGGFGDPEAREQYQRKIDHLKLQISLKNNMRVGAISALIGVSVGGGFAIITSLLIGK